MGVLKHPAQSKDVIQHPTQPRLGEEGVYMRSSFPFFTVLAVFGIVLAVFYANHHTPGAMFSRFKEKVHDRLHGRDQQGSQPPPIPPNKPTSQYPGASAGSSACPPPVQKSSPESFAILRKRWLHQILGDFEKTDLNEPAISAGIAKLSKDCEGLLKTWEPREEQIFRNTGPWAGSNFHAKNTHTRLMKLSMSWATPGTAQYQNDEVLQKILFGLDTLYQNFWMKHRDDINKCLDNRTNWWALQIGAPQNMADTGVILYDVLGPERRQKWSELIVYIVRNPAIVSLKGGNRAWISRILIITGIFSDNAQILNKGIQTMSAEGGGPEVKKSTLFAYIRPGDGEGLYEDGSLVSHDVYPYAGGYGLVMLNAVGCLLNLLNSDESPEEFRVRDPDAGIIYDAVERNFLPVVWEGIVFEHVRGRGIAAGNIPGWDSGHGLINAAALLSKGAPPETASTLQSLVRRWDKSNPRPVLSTAGIPQIPLLQSILSNHSIQRAQKPTGCFSAPMQEHFAYHSPVDDNGQNWCFTLSLSSTRIGRAECLNNQNTKSWYQGDGMTYLYTSTHKTHFADDYWPTMDPLHCPGVTNHLSDLPAFEYKTMGYKDWSGGVCWAGGGGGIGVAYKSGGVGARFAAVSLDNVAVDRKCESKKSWFLTEKGIIALGAGVKGSGGSEVHTTIESRNLDKLDKMIVINGEEYKPDPGWMKKSQRVHWAWIEDTAGYVFLDASDRSPREKIFTKIRKCGKWRDIDGDGKLDEVTRDYFNIVANHGVDPKDSSYAYAILPLADKGATADTQANPPWRVIENSVNTQMIQVAFDGGEVIMATFWQMGDVNGIKVKQPCQLIWGRWGGEWCLSVSDPTHKMNRVVVEIPVLKERGLKLKNKTDDGILWGEGSTWVTFQGLCHGAGKHIWFTEGGGHDEL